MLSYSQSSYSPFPSPDAVYFSQSVDIVQTKSFSLQSTIPPWLCHLFFADLYCLRVIVTGGGQRTTCKQQHRERPCGLLWQRECAQRSALCFVPHSDLPTSVHLSRLKGDLGCVSLLFSIRAHALFLSAGQ